VRWQRGNAPAAPLHAPVAERFWAKVNEAAPNGCWEWTGARDRGYGRFSDGRRTVYAHRFAYEELVGPIPEGKQLDHLCRNRACVKVIADKSGPAHLEPVTGRVNTLRSKGVTAIAARATRCPQGHPYDLHNTYFNPRGHRSCRTCKRESDRRRHERVGGRS